MIKGVVFDMDGVISDTQVIHSRVESELFSEYGVNISPDQVGAKYAGVKCVDFFGEVLGEERMSNLNLDDLVKEKWLRMMETINQNGVKEMPGAIKFIYEAWCAGLKIGLASASNMDYIKAVLSKLAITNMFDAITSSDEVKNGKPAPDVFLLAAQRINVDPRYCVVVEDGQSGAIGAINAGMKCVFRGELINNRIYRTDFVYEPDIVVPSLEQLSIDQIINL